jgi:hypothetical protein
MGIFSKYLEMLNEGRLDFRVGDEVETTMGVKRVGKIIKPFYWKDSTDGTYKAPESKKYLPVQWNDGLKGYHNQKYLKLLKKR